MLTISGTSGIPPTALPFMVGQVCFFARAEAPSGFLVCDGSVVSRKVYSELFSVMGTLFGAGDGVSTFKLPDLRGEFIRGMDMGRGVDAGRALGSWQSSATVGGGLAQFESGRNPAGENNSAGAENVPADGSWSGWRVTGRSLDGDDHHIRMRNAGAIAGAVVHPRNMALLPCVYVGTPVAPNFTAAVTGWYPSGNLLSAVQEAFSGIQSSYSELAFKSNGAIVGATNSGAPTAYLSTTGLGYGANFEISVQVQTREGTGSLTVFGTNVIESSYQSGWFSLGSDRVVSAFAYGSGTGAQTITATGTISIRSAGQTTGIITIPFSLVATASTD